MKIEFIKRGAATRLILIFAGWSTDARFYSGCVVDGWDTAVVSDYRDLSFPSIPMQYSTVYIFAYSLGVWAASCCGIDASLRVAVCGTCAPVSDYLGIPEKVFNATAISLSQRNLLKFHRRMAGDRVTFDKMAAMLPSDADIDALRDELLFISSHVGSEWNADYRWDRAYVAMKDNIFPPSNQLQFWSEFNDTQIVRMPSHHCVDFASIVKHCVPNPVTIGGGFTKASSTYRKNAVVQAEVCEKIGEILRARLGENKRPMESLLEIGPGSGMLTDVWSRILNAGSATYVDLCPMPEFRKAESEEYVVADAEEWMEFSDRKFDVILSASTIQWFADPIRFVRRIKSCLKRGGVAVVSTFVAGNLSELDELRPSPIIYRRASDYLVSSDVESVQWTRTISFDSPRELLLHLRNTGVTPLRGREEKIAGSGVLSRPLKMTGLPPRLSYTPMILIIGGEP